MKKLIIYALLLITVACTRHVSPESEERKISEVLTTPTYLKELDRDSNTRAILAAVKYQLPSGTKLVNYFEVLDLINGDYYCRVADITGKEHTLCIPAHTVTMEFPKTKNIR